jgi:hypothetical protein
MIRPHYVAQRVGDDYVLVRVDTAGQVERAIAGTIGTSLVAKSILRGGLTSLVGCVVGAGLIYHACTGRDPLSLLTGKKNCAKEGDQKDTPSGAVHGTVSKQVPSDPIEEAQMESFPASDPPASMHRETPGAT